MSNQDKSFDYLTKLETHKEDICPVCMNNICLCPNPTFQQYKNCLAIFKRKAKSKSWLMHLIR